MIFLFRGNPADYNSWSDQGFTGWDWDTIFPYFLKFEGMEDEEILSNDTLAAYHNTQGPVKVTRAFYNKHVESKLDILQESLKEIGIKTLLDYNGPEQLGIGRCCYNQASGIRYSTAQAFLTASNDRDNLIVLRNAEATKILIEQTHATGVEFKFNNETINVFAKKEVIVSAGAINTPKLLIASGIGPKDTVEGLGLTSLADLPVGESMLDHPLFPLVFAGNSTIALDRDYNISVDHAAFPTMTGFIDLDNDTRPDIQILTPYVKQNFTTLLNGTMNRTFNYNNDVVRSMLEVNAEKEVFIINTILLHEVSRGKVVVEDLNSSPKIYTGFLKNQKDIDTYRSGIKKILGLLNTTYFESVNASLIKVNLTACDDDIYLSDDYWACYVKELATTLWHPVGTCAMGAVVDETLMIKGFENLRIIDASIMPTSPSGNTNVPSMMVGEKGADLIKSHYLL